MFTSTVSFLGEIFFRISMKLEDTLAGEDCNERFVLIGTVSDDDGSIERKGGVCTGSGSSNDNGGTRDVGTGSGS